MNRTPDPFAAALDALAARLQAEGGLRVWSLAITIFGDAIVPRGGRVGLATLREIVGRIGIEAGALRTALSRLATDGWVVREREGRNSFFRLAEGGRHAFDRATRRIYAAGPPAWDGRWIVALRPGGDTRRSPERDRTMRERGFAAIGPAAWLSPLVGGADLLEGLPDDVLVVEGTARRTPADVARLWRLEEIADAYLALTHSLDGLARALEAVGRPAPLDAIAARTLVNHAWRRIVLRDPGLPAALLSADWPGEIARARVKAIYAGLDEASEAWLDAAGLPAREGVERFGGRR